MRRLRRTSRQEPMVTGTRAVCTEGMDSKGQIRRCLKEETPPPWGCVGVH